MTMRDTRRRSPLACCVASVALTSGVAACQGGEPASIPDAPDVAVGRVESVDPRVPFVGTWRLARVERYDQSGVPLPDLVHDTIGVGEALGYLMYDGERMATVVQQENRTSSAGDGLTPEDAQAAVESYTAYFGRYSVNEASGYVSYEVAGSLNPSGAGGETQPFFELSANQLVLTPSLQCPDSFLTDRGCGYGTIGVQLRNVWEKIHPSAAAVDDARHFLGFWEIDRIERQFLDGNDGAVPIEQYAKGYLIYMPSGYMAVHLMRPDRRAYEGARPTVAEADATMRGYVSYTGPFSVHADEGVVVHHQAGHLNPTRVGEAARRAFEFQGDQLILEPPVSTIDGRPIQTRVFWNRLSTLDTDLPTTGDQSRKG